MKTANNNHIIVNYHYIEDPSPEWGGIHPCPTAEFEKQIKYLAENYKIVSVDEVYFAAKKKKNGHFAAISFDDGLKDQYANALPILEKYGATAIFFPITSTFDGNVPGTHKLHILLSKFSAQLLIDRFNKEEIGFAPIPTDKRMTNERQLYSDIPTVNLKETLLSIPPHVKDSFLDKTFKALGLDEKKIAKELFMSEEEIKSLKAKGFAIGSHTHGHYSLSSLDEKSIKEEIRTSKKILGELLGEFPTAFTYPHGIRNEKMTLYLENEGFKIGFSIEARPVMATDDPFFIPRLDTNDLMLNEPFKNDTIKHAQ
ncbi:hypothetical protein A2W54_00755 [Candidatus Giovannonibacteria bacterium RIFCSPHIGHO2_02_43_13]|uniref:NodB homology domain-containing protein n=1 Tax=Candidatus Giovannonibacteria bacterium RIFCSPHIGHO2_02_43_13 TaxID=1798330 RepID=A0A1F5WU80_9BACT|nr:MAG: Polysaccharide deacetylase [Parcubacteria group bacterium GW2011_GWA2_44_13]OGF74164.1 MAG: hypothetical protein A3E06_03845 [Candidatus Giovannonibacteria bacterium RIFCSPHIGHO2_12_FULL_44_42]OGF79173.1 MAG: hypothetical protein A2W54_00755 [Candidatus Giovannonibacteria bacterium RIFCSPHIGHO2_02_43_13]OGF97526.1 MAG: hypothetical protein A3H08_00155 [Candidatus Giovannonibacteria bacterium RIFCSPLOWO2_12_FULL_44_32]